MTDTSHQAPKPGLADLAELAERLRSALADLLPSGLETRGSDPIGTAIRQVLSNADLVPRQELDAHLNALNRLEERVAQLERQLAEQDRTDAH